MAIHDDKLRNIERSSLTNLNSEMVPKETLLVKIYNETVLVNINNLAKQLLVSKTEIQEAVKENKLLELLVSRINSGLTYQKIDQYYKNHNPGQENEREKAENLGEPAGLTSELLMKVIESAQQKIIKELLSGKDLKTGDKTLREMHYFEAESRVFAVKLSKKGGMKLTEVGKSLGSGTYGEAFVHFNLNKGIEEVYKQAKPDDVAKKDVQNEFQILNEIHSNGTVWGIQAKPKKMVVIHKEGAEDSIGFLGKKYDGDYLKDIQAKPSEPFRNRLFEFHQLLFGLNYLHTHNILHKDLKLQNILVKQEPDGSKSVHIADLGGAQDASKLDAVTLAQGISTKIYYPKEDEEASQLFLRNESKGQQIAIQQKRDVFAMGVILHQALSKELWPYWPDSSWRPDLSQIHEVEDPLVPQEIKDLIKSMLNPDYTKRPSTMAAFNILNKYIEVHEPALAIEIQEKMSSLKKI